MSRDHSAAKKFRDVVAAIARAEIEKRFPEDRYAQVREIDTDARRVLANYNGEPEDNLVSLPYNSVVPSYVGQWVRVSGPPGDRHIVDTLGGAAGEVRVEEVLDLPPVYPKWFQHNPRIIDTGPISTRPDEFEILNITNNSINGSVIRIPGRMVVSQAVVHLARGGSGQFRVLLYRMTRSFDAELITQTALTSPTYHSDQFVSFEDSVTLERGEEVLVALHNRTGSTVECSGWTHKGVRSLGANDALSYARTGQTTPPDRINAAQWNSKWNDRIWYFSLLEAE